MTDTSTPTQPTHCPAVVHGRAPYGRCTCWREEEETPSPSPATVTIPAYAADTLGESVMLCAPAAWHDRIRAIAATGATTYGPSFRRSALSNLLNMSRAVRDGYSTLAYDYLVRAEQQAGITT